MSLSGGCVSLCVCVCGGGMRKWAGVAPSINCISAVVSPLLSLRGRNLVRPVAPSFVVLSARPFRIMSFTSGWQKCHVYGCMWRGMFFDCPRPQTWWDCRKKLLVEVSSLLLLPKVATAGKSVWMVYVLSSELGSLLPFTFISFALSLVSFPDRIFRARRKNGKVVWSQDYPLPSFTAILAVKQSALSSFFATCLWPSGS